LKCHQSGTEVTTTILLVEEEGEAGGIVVAFMDLALL
jgi:hypothetical protein